MYLSKLREFLDSYDIKYVVISHSVAYTAQGIAALAHIPGKELAKTIIVKLDGELAMAVLPASHLIDTAALASACGCRKAELATEAEFKDRFPDCEVGAMPPFGHLYGMKVFAEESLSRDQEIAFNAGSHRELIRMSWSDYERLVQPRVLRFAAGRRSTAA
jgi:Ala-tRNA(Pro) deacylase